MGVPIRNWSIQNWQNQSDLLPNSRNHSAKLQNRYAAQPRCLRVCNATVPKRQQEQADSCSLSTSRQASSPRCLSSSQSPCCARVAAEHRPAVAAARPRPSAVIGASISLMLARCGYVMIYAVSQCKCWPLKRQSSATTSASAVKALPEHLRTFISSIFPMSDAVNPKAFPLATPELTVSILEIVQQVNSRTVIL
jgi:hypothetical protein